jgi:large subunit ribosomal protein L22e
MAPRGPTTTEEGKKKIKGTKQIKKVTYKFNLDCRQQVKDGIFNLNDFVKFLTKSYKVNGKKENLKDVAFIRKNDKLKLQTETKIKKKYVKYLLKKYLKKNNLSEWLHVVSSQKDKKGYDLRYFKISKEGGAEEEEEEDQN